MPFLVHQYRKSSLHRSRTFLTSAWGWGNALKREQKTNPQNKQTKKKKKRRRKRRRKNTSTITKSQLGKSRIHRQIAWNPQIDRTASHRQNSSSRVASTQLLRLFTWLNQTISMCMRVHTPTWAHTCAKSNLHMHIWMCPHAWVEGACTHVNTYTT